MAKNSGSTRLKGSSHDAEFDIIGGYNIPVGVAKRQAEIASINTYNKLKDYLAESGIKLQTGIPEMEQRGDEVMKNVAAIASKIVVAIETFKTMFGDRSLDALKSVILSDKTLDSHAAYMFNEKGENDPLAGTIRVRSLFSSGRDILHEVGHAFIDSIKRPGENLLDASTRLIEEVGMSDKIQAYSGAKGAHRDAERVAEAFGLGFTTGGKEYDDFIYRLRKYLLK